MASERDDREKWLREEQDRFLEEIRPLVKIGNSEEAVKKIDAASELGDELDHIVVLNELDQKINELNRDLERGESSRRMELELEQDKLIKDIEPSIDMKDLDAAIKQIRMASKITEDLNKLGNGDLKAKIKELEVRKKEEISAFRKGKTPEEATIIEEAAEYVYSGQADKEIMESLDALTSISEEYETSGIVPAYEQMAMADSDYKLFCTILGVLCSIVGVSSLMFATDLALPLMGIGFVLLLLFDIIPRYVLKR